MNSTTLMRPTNTESVPQKYGSSTLAEVEKDSTRLLDSAGYQLNGLKLFLNIQKGGRKVGN